MYPGTIRRLIIEHKSHLFIYTSGVGINNFNNIAETGPNPTVGGRFAQAFGGRSNDKYGALAFRALDREAFKYVQKIRDDYAATLPQAKKK
ncbi:hypothetical protein [Lysobacter capsici]|uniref:hypothetical protein n=1 Tax=Lysobacter capsici TaxID=435897 RepID=UPI00128FE79B|nr:hypothetical protein [Lysobacter capsici]